MVSKSRKSSRPEIVWESIGVFPDCAFAAIGDIRLRDDEKWQARGRHTFPSVVTRRGGFGMIYGLCEQDGVPIEIGIVADDIVAARIEFTNDVDQLAADNEGAWEALARIRIGDGGAVALDKKQQNSEWDGAYPWRHEVPLPAGWYSAEAFMWDGDHLGMRLIKEASDA